MSCSKLRLSTLKLNLFADITIELGRVSFETILRLLTMPVTDLLRYYQYKIESSNVLSLAGLSIINCLFRRIVLDVDILFSDTETKAVDRLSAMYEIINLLA